MKCPKCKEPLTESEVIRLNSQLNGSKKTQKKAMASRKNGILGGRPKKIKTLEMSEQSS